MQNLGSRDQGQQAPAPSLVSPGLYSALWDFLQWEGMCSTVLCLSLEKHQAGDFTNLVWGWLCKHCGSWSSSCSHSFPLPQGSILPPVLGVVLFTGLKNYLRGWFSGRSPWYPADPWVDGGGPLLRGWTRTFGTLPPQGQPVWKAHPLCWGLQGFSCCSWGWEGRCWDRKWVLKELFPRAEVRVPTIRNWAALTGVFPGKGTAEAKEVSPGLTRGGRAEASTSSRWLSQDRNDKLGQKSVYRTLCQALNWLTWE